MIEQKFVCDFCKKMKDMPGYRTFSYWKIEIHAGTAIGVDGRFNGPTIDLAFHLCRPCYRESGITEFEGMMNYEVKTIEDFKEILHKVIRFFKKAKP